MMRQVCIDQDTALCSDDACPCGFPGATIRRGEGYIFVSKEVAEFRKDALTEAQAEKKIRDIKRELAQDRATIFAGSGHFAPILMCEVGAKRRGLDLEIAGADARHWWDTGQVPVRPTPLAGAQQESATTARSASSDKKWWQFWK